MTLLEFKKKVQFDLDLQDEQFIGSDEFLGYVHEAIRECEAEIHKLNLEDSYFLSYETLTLAQGVGAIDLPDDVYATKIRAVQFERAGERYEIHRFRGRRAFADFMYFRAQAASNASFKYLITNTRGEGVKLALAPLPSFTGPCGTIWYIRNAKIVTADADEFDIPEFINFVLQFVKDKCISKERMTPDAPPSPALLQQRELMVSTLTEQVPDGDSGLLETDLSHYEVST